MSGFPLANGGQGTVLQLPHGAAANKNEFAKRARKNDVYWATDEKSFYVASTSASSTPATLLRFAPNATGQ